MSNSLGRLVVVKVGVCGAWCTIWSERVGSGWGSLKCMLPALPIWVELLDVDRAAECVLGMPCFFHCLLSEQGLGRAALYAWISIPY